MKALSHQVMVRGIQERKTTQLHEAPQEPQPTLSSATSCVRFVRECSSDTLIHINRDVKTQVWPDGRHTLVRSDSEWQSAQLEGDSTAGGVEEFIGSFHKLMCYLGIIH